MVYPKSLLEDVLKVYTFSEIFNLWILRMPMGSWRRCANKAFFITKQFGRTCAFALLVYLNLDAVVFLKKKGSSQGDHVFRLMFRLSCYLYIRFFSYVCYCNITSIIFPTCFMYRKRKSKLVMRKISIQCPCVTFPAHIYMFAASPCTLQKQ